MHIKPGSALTSGAPPTFAQDIIAQTALGMPEIVNQV